MKLSKPFSIAGMVALVVTVIVLAGCGGSSPLKQKAGWTSVTTAALLEQVKSEKTPPLTEEQAKCATKYITEHISESELLLLSTPATKQLVLGAKTACHIPEWTKEQEEQAAKAQAAAKAAAAKHADEQRKLHRAEQEAKEAKEKSAETHTQYVPVPTGPACSDNPNVPLPSCTAPNAGGPSWTSARHEAYLNKLEAAGTSPSVAECVTNGIESRYSETEVESLHPTNSLSEQPQAVQEVDSSCEYG